MLRSRLGRNICNKRLNILKAMFRPHCSQRLPRFRPVAKFAVCFPPPMPASMPIGRCPRAYKQIIPSILKPISGIEPGEFEREKRSGQIRDKPKWCERLRASRSEQTLLTTQLLEEAVKSPPDKRACIQTTVLRSDLLSNSIVDERARSYASWI